MARPINFESKPVIVKPLVLYAMVQILWYNIQYHSPQKQCAGVLLSVPRSFTSTVHKRAQEEVNDANHAPGV